MRRLLQGLAMLVGLLLGLGLLYILAAFLLAEVKRAPVARGEIPPGAEIYRYHACDNGVHVDIVLPVTGGGRDWRSFFPPSDFAGDVAQARYVSLGWGAQDFFASTPHWQDIRPGPVLRALFWLDDSVLHVTYHGDPAGMPHCRDLATDAAGKERLFSFIDATLAGNSPRRLPLPGYGPADAFYAATGRYSLFRTCNMWSADALHVAGESVGVWSPFSFQIIAALGENPH